MVLKIGTFGDDMLNGTLQDDVLQGSFGNDVLRGFAGDDIIFGGPGDDDVYGNQGADILHAGPGADTLNGGGGYDTVVFDTDLDVDFNDEDGYAWYAHGSAHLRYIENAVTGDGNDDVRFSFLIDENNVATTGGGNDYVILGAGDDVANLGAGDDFAAADAGDDTVNGGGGADELLAGAGSDRLNGGGGADYLMGSLDVDRVTGGSGADDFVFWEGDSGVGVGNRDAITDFSKADNDEIDLSEFGGLAFIGQSDFSAADQVRFVHSGGDTIVSINTVGNGGAEMQIELAGIVNMAAGDFIF